MNDKEVVINIQGNNNTKKAFSEIGKDFKGLQTDVTGFSKVLLGVGVGAVAGLGAALYSTVKAAGEADLQIAKVTATLATMGKAGEGMKDKILEASEAVTKLGFDDEDAAVSITNLYKKTGDLTKATELNNLAMDIARAKNIDLDT